MSTKVYIGSEQLDFEGEFNVSVQVYDIYDDEIGATNKSYSLELPLSDKNKKALRFANNINAITGNIDVGRIYVDEIPVIKGKVIIISITDYTAKILIEGGDWAGELNDIYIDEIWSSGDTHLLTGVNIQNSWPAGAGALWRYPLMNLGGRPTTTSTNNHAIYFVPIWSIYQIALKLFAAAGLNIDSNSWFHGTVGKSMYLMAPWKKHRTSDFIVNKDFAVRVLNATDNRASITHTAGTTNTVNLNKANIDFDSVISGSGNGWSTANDRYDINESGNYRFELKVAMSCTHDIDGRFSSVVTSCTAYVKYFDGDSTTIIIAQKTATDEIFDGTTPTLTIDTGYFYMVDGGYVYIEIVASSQAYNAGSTMTVYLWTTPTSVSMQFKSDFTQWCEYPGENEPQKPEDYLPHITGVEFLKACKHAFGLVFWYDMFNNKVYVNTFNDFVGSTIIDYSDRRDYSNIIEMEILAANYPKKTELYYKSDTSDTVYRDAVSSSGAPFRHIITLTNDLVKKETDMRENPVFSPTVKKNCYYSLGLGNIALAAIYGDNYQGDLGYVYPHFRTKTFEPRLLEWFGDVSPTSPETLTWYWYDTWNDASPTTKTTYPKVETPPLATNYNSFYKRFAVLDYGRKITVSVRMTPVEFQKFTTVMSSSSTEGFRCLYKILFDGCYALCYVQSIVFNGKQAKITFIQKK